MRKQFNSIQRYSPSAEQGVGTPKNSKLQNFILKQVPGRKLLLQRQFYLHHNSWLLQKYISLSRHMQGVDNFTW